MKIPFHYLLFQVSFLAYSFMACAQPDHYDLTRYVEQKRDAKEGGPYNIVLQHQNLPGLTAIKSYYDSSYSELVIVYFCNDGIAHGPWTTYNPGGTVSVKGQYVNGRREGTFTTFYENGSVRSKSLYRGGLPDGSWEFYSETGRLTSVIYYKEGKPLKVENY